MGASVQPYLRHLLWRQEAQRAHLLQLDQLLRAYFTELQPGYVAVNAHLPASTARRAAQVGDAESFAPHVASNPLLAGWTGTEAFGRDYAMTRAYEFSAVLYLVTYWRFDRPELPVASERGFDGGASGANRSGSGDLVGRPDDR